MSVGATKGVLEIDGLFAKIRVSGADASDIVHFFPFTSGEAHVLGTPLAVEIGPATSSSPT